MPATVTLSSTTLQQTAGASDGQVFLASTTGVLPGYRLWVDRELMYVTSLGIGSAVNVRRGVDGTSSQPHNSLATVTIGRGDQFYSTDPVGRPPDAIPVSPYINVLTGDVWLAQGDVLPVGASVRWWQRVSSSYGTGALGVRTVSSDPTAST